MELIRGLHNLRPRHHGCVATIGNYDGLHLGHRRLLQRVADVAAEQRVPGLVITFEPMPSELFSPDKAPARLASFREKMRDLAAAGVDRVLVLGFDHELAAMPAETLVVDLLHRQLGARHVVVGDDFRFGKGRSGDIGLLQQLGAEHGFSAEGMDSITIDGERVSSTRVRAALADADLKAAEQLLGRPYAMSGRVRHGDKLGRTLGVPTANLLPGRRVALKHGVYCVRVRGADGALTATQGEGGSCAGVANLGMRPTVSGKDLRLEVHIFDFNKEIYGSRLDVEFLAFQRAEARFDGQDALMAQINVDLEGARNWFAARHEAMS